MWLLEDASAQSKVQTRPYGKVGILNKSQILFNSTFKAVKGRGRNREF